MIQTQSGDIAYLLPRSQAGKKTSLIFDATSKCKKTEMLSQNLNFVITTVTYFKMT